MGPHPLSSEQAIDLEEALVAAAASCHMPSFPYGAARRGSTVDRYADAAESLMETIARWHDAITRIVLRPRIDCAGNARPDAVKVGGLHHAAREERYIDNEVLARIVVEDAAVAA